MNDETILETVYERHRAQLKNFNQANPKLIVVFSSIPGSGSTTIAKQVEEHCQGLRFSHNDVRRLIEEVVPGVSESDREEWLGKYDHFFYGRAAKGLNGLVVLDASIDRKYDLVKNWANELGFKLFVIEVKLPAETAIERVKEREGEAAAAYLPHYPRWQADHAKFLATHQVDFSVENEGKPDLSVLFDRLDERLTSRG